jgi:hypothetical protein
MQDDLNYLRIFLSKLKIIYIKLFVLGEKK